MKNGGLLLFVGLMLALVGGLLWLGVTVPDPKSCVAVLARSFQNADRADLKVQTRKACKAARSS